MGFWDMYRYVPTAAWMITAALVLRAAIVAWFLAPGGWFSTPLLRAYLRFDPGAGYLLDLARARRGLPLLRTAGQRLGNLPRTVPFTAGPGRIFLAIARGLDGAIWLLAHAPGYWRRPPGTVQLDLPHVVEVIDTEVASSVASFRRTYLNVSLEEYRSHTVQENLERESEARTCAERLALLLAASAECAFFFRTLLPGSAKTISVAYQQWARAWRFRRRYDGLWFDTASAARPAPASREEAVLERAAEPEAEAAEAGESEELRNSDGTAPAAVDEVVAVATPDGPSGFLEPVPEPLAAAVARGTTPEPAPAEPAAISATTAPISDRPPAMRSPPRM